MFEHFLSTRPASTNKQCAGHRRLSQLLLVFVLLMTSSVGAGTQTAAQNETTDNCVPELLESEMPESIWFSCEEGPQGNAVVKWKKDYPEVLLGVPPAILLGGDILYVAYDNTVQAFAPDTGDPVWETDLGNDIVTDFGLTDRSIIVEGFVHNPDGDETSLNSVSRADGSLQWSIELPPASNYWIEHISDEVVYYLLEDPEEPDSWELRAFNTDDGSELWRETFAIFDDEHSVPWPSTILTNNALFVTYGVNSLYGTLLALDPANGVPQWETRLYGTNTAYHLGSSDKSLIVAEGFARQSRTIRALDLSSGEEVWSAGSKGDDIDNVSVLTRTGDHIYVLLNGIELIVYDVTSGLERWRANAEYEVYDGFVYDGRIYADLGNYGVISIDTATGRNKRQEVENCDGFSAIATFPSEACFRSTEIFMPNGIWGTLSVQGGDGLSAGYIGYLPAGEPPGNEVEFYRVEDSFFSGNLLISDGVVFAAYNDHIIAIGGDEGQHAVEPSQMPAGEGVDIGDTVTIVGGDTVLHAAPAPSGVELASLPEGATVEVIDGPLEENGDTWWQVREPESGYIGYVPAENLAAILE